MKRFFICLSFVFLFLSQVLGQAGRYTNPIFPVNVTYNVSFGSAKNYFGFNQNMTMDIYQPSGDVATKRPLVVFFFGGSFLVGSKNASDVTAMCNDLAKRGYVCAAVSYRLGFTIGSQRSAIRAVYRAVQDSRAAFRYLAANAGAYKLDLNNLYIGGQSAGSITAIHNAFMDTDSKRPTETRSAPWYVLENTDMGCLDCAVNKFATTYKIRGIVNLWGGIYDLNYIDAQNKVPTISIHGEADNTVSINTAAPYSASLFLPILNGSNPFSQRLSSLGSYNEFYSYPNQGHVFYGTPDFTFPNKYWLPVFEQIKTFLYKMVTQPTLRSQELETTSPILIDAVPYDDNTEIATENIENRPFSLNKAFVKNGMLLVEFESDSKQDLNLQVMDIQGQTIMTAVYHAEAGINNLEHPIDDLASGIYLINVNNQIQTNSLKFVK